MSRIRLSIILAALLTLAAIPGSASAQQSCEFRLGFADLQTMIPGVVGDCLSNETHNPDNGDSLQPTTNGLMVWRKADNWTAFTDGATTWISGPLGLQSRPNDSFFSWELGIADPAPSPPRIRELECVDAYFAFYGVRNGPGAVCIYSNGEGLAWFTDAPRITVASKAAGSDHLNWLFDQQLTHVDCAVGSGNSSAFLACYDLKFQVKLAHP